VAPLPSSAVPLRTVAHAPGLPQSVHILPPDGLLQEIQFVNNGQSAPGAPAGVSGPDTPTESAVLRKEYPDHHDAELLLQLYDLRRESVMRESRAALIAKYLPKSSEEALAILRRDHPLNAAFRQVTTYWEMVYGMVKWGILHADFMMESSSEGLLVYARVEPWVAQIRAENPSYFVNAEWIATNSDSGRRALERYRARVKRALEGR
jgi:hypothetical protein